MNSDAILDVIKTALAVALAETRPSGILYDFLVALNTIARSQPSVPGGSPTVPAPPSVPSTDVGTPSAPVGRLPL